MSRLGLILIVLFIADVLSTAWALNVGAQEANPFVRSLLASGGYIAWIAVKSAMTFVAFAAYWFLEPKRFASLSAGLHRAIRRPNDDPVSPALLRVMRFAGAGAPATYMAFVCLNNALIALRLGAGA